MSPSKEFMLSKEMAYARYKSGAGHHRNGCQSTVNVSNDQQPRSALQLLFHAPASAQQTVCRPKANLCCLDTNPLYLPAARARLRWRSILVSFVVLLDKLRD